MARIRFQFTVFKEETLPVNNASASKEKEIQTTLDEFFEDIE